MKIKISVMAAAVAIFLLPAISAAAQKPPAAVQMAFQQKFPNAGDVDWSREKSGEWEAEFETAGEHEISASFSTEGKWLETETEIRFAELPAPVQAALKGKKVKETARIERADGAILFEAEVKRKDLLFDPSGKRLN